MAVLRDYERDDNVWDKNPELLLLPVFKKLYDTDKSKNKKESSDLIHAIFLVYDYESPLANMTKEERIKEAEQLLEHENYFKEAGNGLKPIINLYNKMQKTSPLRYLDTVNDTLEKRRKFLENANYTPETASIIDKMLKDSASLFDQVNKFKQIISEDKGAQIKGGQQLTLLAAGQLDFDVYDKKGTDLEEA